MTRKSKPKRACGMCKPHKYAGNGKEKHPIAARRAMQEDERRGNRR